MIFDRFSEDFRKPVGAVKKGTAVKFTLKIPREIGTAKAFLEIAPDGKGPALVELEWTALDLSCDIYKAEYRFEVEGLYWYSFLIRCGEYTLRLSESGRGEVLKNADEAWSAFQQTVYKQDFDTPEWLKKGVIYQIFPDRFYKADTVAQAHGYLHENWYDEPDYDNDPLKITNSDFFGGNLRGITEKLPYIASLGVTVIYLNPIFKAYSNHRYDTGDYEQIDPLLGTEEDFACLCKKASEFGIHIVLDGVFSHTGADSRYFNLFGGYDSLGAAQSAESPYFNWYDFQRHPDKYTCWWGVWSLPCVNETNPDFLRFITGENGIARRYIRLGASGWRLDVADELPDGFLDEFRKAVKAENPDTAIIGEVWEDASNKIAYSSRRRYLLGDQLDSVMNYPFSNALLDFARNGNSSRLASTVLAISEHYPACVLSCLMNMLSTHDTPRAITALAGEPLNGRDRSWQSTAEIPEENFGYAKKLLKLASALQYTLPGIPSLYYGDEAGLQGYSDPFNRRTFPWGREDKELTDWFVFLGNLRRLDFAREPFKLLYEQDGVIAYQRGRLTVYANGTGDGRQLGDCFVKAKEAKIFFDGKELK